MTIELIHRLLPKCNGKAIGRKIDYALILTEMLILWLLWREAFNSRKAQKGIVLEMLYYTY